MPYDILDYTKQQAKRWKVEVRPSLKKGKKIDIFYKDKYLTSVGGYGYKDYPTYLKEQGKEVADKRRKAYKARHQKDRMVVGSNGWWADQLLW